MLSASLNKTFLSDIFIVIKYEGVGMLNIIISGFFIVCVWGDVILNKRTLNLVYLCGVGDWGARGCFMRECFSLCVEREGYGLFC